MLIYVKFFGGFRAVARGDGISLNLASGANVKSALQALLEEVPALRGKLRLGREGLPQHVNVFLNGKNVLTLEGLDTPLSEGDVLTLFPPMGGG